MAERPILFSPPMVRAIRADLKSQTRRVVNGLRRHGRITEFGRSDTAGYDWHFRDKALRWHDVRHARLLELAPYRAGDVLWVRETWCVSRQYDAVKPSDLKPHSMTVFYAAGGSCANMTSGKWDHSSWPANEAELPDWVGKLRPSIFLPRWAARILLRVKSVRVERLQAISAADAIAEGIPAPANCFTIDCDTPDPRVEFRALWDSLNAGRGFGWQADPWVWVIEFERCEAPRAAA